LSFEKDSPVKDFALLTQTQFAFYGQTKRGSCLLSKYEQFVENEACCETGGSFDEATFWAKLSF